MNPVPFSERFQLLDLKRDEGARTFEAREIATGRPVFVHFFVNTTAPLNRALLAKLDTLPEDERYRIIDRGPHEAGIYLVTDRLAEFGGLREWLQAKNENRVRSLDAGGAWQIKAPSPPVPPPNPFDTAPLPTIEPSPTEAPPASILTNSGEQTLQFPTPPDPPPVVTPAPAPAANEPGEFTRQFAIPVQRPVAPPPPPPANEAGEFTRQFAPSVLRPVPKEPPPTPPPSQPGEFTQLFAAPPLKPAPPPKAAAPPGEFTRQFQAPQRAAPAPSTPAPRTPPPASQPPGEFTQMLQAQRPAAAAPPVPPANQSPSSGEFTRYFQSPMTPTQPGPANYSPLTPPRPPSQPKDAGEFTQIFGRGDIPSGPPPQAPAAPPNPASANATQVFAIPRPASPVPMSQPNVPPQGMQQGPGEYTQMFAKPASPTFGQAPSGPPAHRAPEPVPARRNSSRLPLLLVIGAVVLLIIAIAVYIGMRPHTT